MRLPEFLIIGTMKSGTTSLHAWLGEHPDVYVSPVKEPNFFSRDQVWARGLGWYSDLFAGASSQQVAGEASVSYSSPSLGAAAAARIAKTLPDVRLVYLLRHPIERTRSHYRHEVQRGRETRSFAGAIRDQESTYVKHSLYHTCLEPYIPVCPREQICVVRFEDLVTAPYSGWQRILSHIGAPARRAPGSTHNVTAEKGRFTRPMLWLWEARWSRFSARIPQPIRRVAKKVLIRQDRKYLHRMEESRAPIPKDVAERIENDVARLEDWLGVDRPLWSDYRAAGTAEQKTMPLEGRSI